MWAPPGCWGEIPWALQPSFRSYYSQESVREKTKKGGACCDPLSAMDNMGKNRHTTALTHTHTHTRTTALTHTHTTALTPTHTTTLTLTQQAWHIPYLRNSLRKDDSDDIHDILLFLFHSKFRKYKHWLSTMFAGCIFSF